MVLSIEVIRNNPSFHVAWLLGTDDENNLSRRDVLSQDVPKLCGKIQELIPQPGGSLLHKTGLYKLAVLVNGTVKAHRIQVSFLERDAKKLKELMKKRSFVMMFAEQFDRQVEAVKADVNAKFRSVPILHVEDIDKWVDLADLPMISEQIGINGDPRDLTIADALPNEWLDVNADLTGLYGSIRPFSPSRGDYTMHSTFVEGNGSDANRERRIDAILADVEEISFAPREQEVRKEPEVVAEFQQQQPQNQTEDQNPAEETMQFAQCSLLDSRENLEAPPPPPPPAAAPEEFDLPLVAPHSQALYQEYLDATVNAPSLLPMPDGIDFITAPPAPKRQKTEELPEEQEKARQRASSRPVTPLNLTDFTSRTNVDMTRQDLDEFSLELDSQIVVPLKKPSTRKMPPIYGDDMEIDVNIQKALQADYSSLVRPMADVLVPRVSKIREDFDLPALGIRMSDAVKELLRPVYRRYIPADWEDSDDSDSEEEDQPEKRNTLAQDVEIPMFEDTRLQNPLIIEEPVEQVRFGTTSLLEVPEAPEASERIEFGMTRLDSPELSFAAVALKSPTRREQEIIEQLQLQPIEDPLEFSHPIADKENVRRRQKSSLGIQSRGMEELEEDTTQRERRVLEEERNENRRIARDASFPDEELDFFTTGSLLPDNRQKLRDALLVAIQQKHPEPLELYEHTERYLKKEAATVFTELLVALKNCHVTATQDEPYGPIFVRQAENNEN